MSKVFLNSFAKPENALLTPLAILKAIFTGNNKIFTKNFLKSLDTDLKMCYNKYIKKGHLLVIGRC